MLSNNLGYTSDGKAETELESLLMYHSRVDGLALAVPVPEHRGDPLGGGGDVAGQGGRAAGRHPYLDYGIG